MRNPSFGLILILPLLALGAMSASAFNIDSIQLEVRESTYAVQVGDSIPELLAEFAGGSLICSRPLPAVDLVGSVQSCDGPSEDIATLISLEISGTDAEVTFEFGPEWGLGGVIFLENAITLGSGVEDFWWKRDWNNPDVFRFTVEFEGFQQYTLSFLGFEPCCGGPMSLRYTEDVDEGIWTPAEVSSVPLPSSLTLLAAGLLGLCRRPRRYSRRG